MISWKKYVVLGLIVCFIMSLFAITVLWRLRNDIKRGKIVFEQIRLYKGGNTYIIDQIEGLGRSKWFLSFKQED